MFKLMPKIIDENRSLFFCFRTGLEELESNKLKREIHQREDR